MFLYKIPSVTDFGLYALSQLQAEGHFDYLSPDKLQEILNKIGRNDLSNDIKEYKRMSVFQQAVKLEAERQEKSRASVGTGGVERHAVARLLSGAETQTAATEERRDMVAMALTQTAQLVEQASAELLRITFQDSNLETEETLCHIKTARDEVKSLSSTLQKAISAARLIPTRASQDKGM